MPHFFSRFSAFLLAFTLAFSSLQFSAENLFQEISFSTAYANMTGGQTPTSNPAGGDGDGERESEQNNNTYSTLGKTQSELTTQDMRGYQSLYEMQAELFAECVAKLKCIASHDYELAGRLPLQRAREILKELKRQMAGEGDSHG